MGKLLSFLDDSISRQLMDSLRELMQATSIDDIKTSVLLQKSGVGRTTFYRRFRNKYDLLNRCFEKNTERLLKEYYSKDKSFKESFCGLLRTMEGDIAFFRNAFSSREPDSLKYYMLDTVYDSCCDVLKLAETDTTQPVVQVKMRAFVVGVIEVISIWLEKQTISICEVIEIVLELMPEELKLALIKYYL